MRRKPILMGAVVGLALAAVLAAVSGGADGRPRSGAELYQRLAEAATDGDWRAAAEVAALDAYMAERGLEPDDLGVPAFDSPRTDTSSGLVRLTVVDQAPWRITIHNDTTFATGAEIAAYRAARHAALDALAADNPLREVEAVISPAGASSVPDFLKSLVCPCAGVHLIVDVFGPKGWMMTSGREITGRDVSEEARAIEAEILNQAAASLDGFPGVGRSDLRAEVRMVRMKMTAESALETSWSSQVLAIDLLTDIADAYAGRAAIVEVTGTPDLRYAHAQLVLGRPIDASPVSPVRP